MKIVLKIFFLLLIPFFLSITFLKPNLSLGVDDVIYLNLAISLSEGMGYKDIWLPEPTLDKTYPPGLPFLLAVIIKFFGIKIILSKICCIIFFLASITVLYLILNKNNTREFSFWYAFLFGISPIGIGLSRGINSEPVFFFFSFLALGYFLNLEDKKFDSWKYFILTLVFTICSYYVRSAGLMIFFAVISYLIYRKQFKSLVIFFILYLIFISPWIILTQFDSNVADINRMCNKDAFLLKDPFAPHLGTISIKDFVVRVYKNFLWYTGKVFADIFTYPFFISVVKGFNFKFLLKLVLSLVLSFLCFLGFIKTVIKKITVFEFYVVFTFILCLSWTYHDGRFLLPVLPILFFYILENFKNKNLKYGIITLIAILFLSSNIWQKKELMSGGVNFLQNDYLKCYQWVKTNTPQNSIIMGSYPPGVYFYANRKGVSYPLSKNYSNLLKVIKENNIKYIICEFEENEILSRSLKYLKPHILNHPNEFTLVYSGGEFAKVYLKN